MNQGFPLRSPGRQTALTDGLQGVVQEKSAPTPHRRPASAGYGGQAVDGYEGGL